MATKKVVKKKVAKKSVAKKKVAKKKVAKKKALVAEVMEPVANVKSEPAVNVIDTPAEAKKNSVKKSKEKKTRTSKKQVLDFTEVSTYQERLDMVNESLSNIYGNNFMPDAGSISINNVVVYVRFKEMKPKVGGVGIRSYIVRNEKNYTLGEYNNKLSVSNIVRKVEEFSKS